MTSTDRDPTPAAGAPGAPTGEGSRSAASGPRERPARRSLPLWQETVLLLGIAVLLAVVIKALFLQAFYIPSESMEPGLVRNDRILVEKVSYWGEDTPRRGDVVVFEDPGGWLNAAEAAGPSGPVASVLSKIGLYPTGGHLVKRVVGVAGDTVTCCDGQGRISVNGVPLEEPYVKDDPSSPCNGPMTGTCDWTAGPVPAGHLFVMGDNRRNSADSSRRICRDDQTDCVPGREFVPVDLVVGKVFVLAWPASRFDWVQRPAATFADVPDGSQDGAAGPGR